MRIAFWVALLLGLFLVAGGVEASDKALVAQSCYGSAANVQFVESAGCSQSVRFVEANNYGVRVVERRPPVLIQRREAVFVERRPSVLIQRREAVFVERRNRGVEVRLPFLGLRIRR
jgi:hypothetical protein